MTNTIVPDCICTLHQHQHQHQYQPEDSNPCSSCGGGSSSLMVESDDDNDDDDGVFESVPQIVSAVISGALTGFFALAGAFTGALTGALAGRASHAGVLRGAGLGAIAGAVLSLELLQASRAYWCLQLSGTRGSSSMADFIEELLRGRFVEDQFTPAMLTTYHWQVSIASLSYDEIDLYDEVASRGLSGEKLKKLPCHVVSDEIKATPRNCCTICLQDVQSGEVARTLPQCNHMFHLSCVDKWLIRHGSCPVCRQKLHLGL
ncbi:hypothetical protein ACFE04_025106 [Oxalis oulophora]